MPFFKLNTKTMPMFIRYKNPITTNSQEASSPEVPNVIGKRNAKGDKYNEPIHQPDRFTSCIRRIATARLGKNNTNETKAETPLSSKSMIPEAAPKSIEKRTNHQYSERLALPENTNAFLKQTLIASKKYAFAPLHCHPFRCLQDRFCRGLKREAVACHL